MTIVSAMNKIASNPQNIRLFTFPDESGALVNETGM
jgi:hypothetical protein